MRWRYVVLLGLRLLCIILGRPACPGRRARGMNQRKIQAGSNTCVSLWWYPQRHWSDRCHYLHAGWSGRTSATVSGEAPQTTMIRQVNTHTLYQNNTATKINYITATFRNNERISGAFHLLPVSFPSPRAPGRSWHRAGQATVPCFLVPKQRARMSGGQLAASVVDEVVSRV